MLGMTGEASEDGDDYVSDYGLGETHWCDLKNQNIFELLKLNFFFQKNINKLPVVVVIREEASSSESTKLVDSKSELIMEDDSYSCPALCLRALCPLRGA